MSVNGNIETPAGVVIPLLVWSVPFSKVLFVLQEALLQDLGHTTHPVGFRETKASSSARSAACLLPCCLLTPNLRYI